MHPTDPENNRISNAVFVVALLKLEDALKSTLDSMMKRASVASSPDDPAPAGEIADIRAALKEAKTQLKGEGRTTEEARRDLSRLVADVLVSAITGAVTRTTKK